MHVRLFLSLSMIFRALARIFLPPCKKLLTKFRSNFRAISIMPKFLEISAGTTVERFGPGANFALFCGSSRIPKIIVSGPTLLSSSANLGQHENRLIRQQTLSFHFLLITPLVFNWLIWQNGKHP